MDVEIKLGDGEPHTVELVRRGDAAVVTVDGRSYDAALATGGPEPSRLTVDTVTEPVWTAVDGDTVWVHAFGRSWELSVVDPRQRALGGDVSVDVSTAPMPGTVITVSVESGQAVGAGERLVVIESMKMQSEIVAMRDGEVDQVFVAVGDTFDRGAPLVGLAPLSDGGSDNEDGEG
jgi:acetyl/propionyl-CoA carboxylase alpha subunit